MQLVDCKRKKGRRPLILHESLCLELFPSVSFLTLPPSYPFPLHPRLAFPFSSHCPQPSFLFPSSLPLPSPVPLPLNPASPPFQSCYCLTLHDYQHNNKSNNKNNYYFYCYQYYYYQSLHCMHFDYHGC